MDGWNTTFLLGRPIFRGYVSFREGNFHGHPSKTMVFAEMHLPRPLKKITPSKSRLPCGPEAFFQNDLATRVSRFGNSGKHVFFLCFFLGWVAKRGNKNNFKNSERWTFIFVPKRKTNVVILFNWSCVYRKNIWWSKLSGQIIIFHQPRFSWNKGISLTKPPFGVRSCEVAIIWPEVIYESKVKISLSFYAFFN